MRGFKIAHAPLRRRLEQAEARVSGCYSNGRNCPNAWLQIADPEEEKKQIVDTIKIAAYQVETELLVGSGRTMRVRRTKAAPCCRRHSSRRPAWR